MVLQLQPSAADAHPPHQYPGTSGGRLLALRQNEDLQKKLWSVLSKFRYEKNYDQMVASWSKLVDHKELMALKNLERYERIWQRNEKMAAQAKAREEEQNLKDKLAQIDAAQAWEDFDAFQELVQQEALQEQQAMEVEGTMRACEQMMPIRHAVRA